MPAYPLDAAPRPAERRAMSDPIKAALAALGWQQVPPSCVVVPMEPTQEQIRAAIERPHTKSEDMYHSIYRAMVGAAKLDDEK